MVVEDNPVNQQVAQALLEGIGVTVQLAGNGEQALSKLGRGTFDVVMMDIQMPGMDGFEATRRIRALGRCGSIPIVAMTAHAMADDRQRCLEAGMDGYVPKPVDPDRLFRVLARWLPAVDSATPPVSAHIADRSALPESIAGIDLAWGLERVGGNSDLFRKLLADFLQQHGDAVGYLERTLAVGDEAEILREVHTLRGVSGNIGAREVEQAAHAWETALRKGDSVAGGALPADFRSAFDTVIESLRQLDLLTRENLPSALDGDGFVHALERLDGLLVEGDPEARDRVAELLNAALSDDVQAEVEQLRDAVDEYDFDLAREKVQQLLSGWRTSHEQR